MNILVVSSYLPYPLYSGGHIRLFNLLKRLSDKHTITLICEKRENQTDDDIQEVEKICNKVITVNRKKQWSLKNVMRSGFSTDSFLIAGHRNKDLQKAIADVIQSQSIDLIHVETSYVMQNVPQTAIPIVLVEHNIEYLVYQRFVDKVPLVTRPLLQIDIEKLLRFEQSTWKRASIVAAVSPQEKQIIQKIKKEVEVISNGVDIEKFKLKSEKTKNEGKEKRLLFIGDFKWIQNRDAAEFILKEIWPEVSAKCKLKSEKLSLWIVGKHIPEYIKQLGSHDVIFDEGADDAVKVFHAAYVLLAIIRVGGGTSYKILEAMSSGTPVITTSLGKEGIVADNEKDILVADSKKAILDAIEKLLQDEKFYNKIAMNARKQIETHYNWDVIAKNLDDLYTSVVTKKT